MESLQPFLNPTDISIAVIILFGILGGIRRGLSGELLRVATIIIAIIAGWKFAEAGAQLLAHWSEWPAEDLKAIAFFGIIILVYCLCGVIRVTLHLLLDFSFKGKLERLGGALLGFLRSIVFCVFILLAASLIPSEPVQDYLRQSQASTWITTHVRPIYDEWAEHNPAFKLPAIEKLQDIKEELPPWEKYMGPLIEPIDEKSE